MAAWLIAALNLLRSLAVGTPTRALITGGTAGAVGALDFLPFFGDGDEEKKRRRRRRRALTQSDRNDIAFIAWLVQLGPCKHISVCCGQDLLISDHLAK